MVSILMCEEQAGEWRGVGALRRVERDRELGRGDHGRFAQGCGMRWVLGRV